MKTIICCEGTTDLLMIQFVLQFKYGWKYKGYEEDKSNNRLLVRELKRGNDIAKIMSCGGIMKIPNELEKIFDRQMNVTKQDEIWNRIIIMIDHDTEEGTSEFLTKLNGKIQQDIRERQLNSQIQLAISNSIFGNIPIELQIQCIPKNDTGAIEKIMLEALNTDEVEDKLIKECDGFIQGIVAMQERYLQRQSRVSKAVFNTYFAIRAPEEKYDERARILNVYDWKNNEVLNSSFTFLDI